MISNTHRFNYVIATADDAYPGYYPVKCFTGLADTPENPAMCLYRRIGGCD